MWQNLQEDSLWEMQPEEGCHGGRRSAEKVRVCDPREGPGLEEARLVEGWSAEGAGALPSAQEDRMGVGKSVPTPTS